MNRFSSAILRLKSLVCVAVVLFICVYGVGTTVSAAETARISVGSASTTVGEEVTVIVSITTSGQQTAGYIKLSYDPGIIEYVSGGTGGGGTVVLYTAGESSVAVRFKAKAAGSSAISIADAVIGVGAEDNATVSRSNGSIRVNAPANYSSDNNLKSLSISPGVLSPAFSPNVTEYTTSVGADCSALAVSAVANDGKAKVSISGKRMDPGKNTTTITVTAENGSKKVYKIYTTKDSSAAQETTAAGMDGQTKPDDKKDPEAETKADGEAENSTDIVGQSQNIVVNENEYRVLKDLSDHPLPQGYELITYDFNGLSVAAGKGINNKIILMYLENTDGNGESGFYVYDSVTKEFTPYIEIGQPAITYVILPITDNMEKPDGFELTKYNIGGRDVDVLMGSSNEFCLFYGIDSNGVTGWFKYNCNDLTIQTYAPDGKTEAANTQQGQSKSSDIWKMTAVILIVVCVILIAAVVILGFMLRRHKKMLLDVIKHNSGLEPGDTTQAAEVMQSDDADASEEDILLQDDEEDYIEIEEHKETDKKQ